MDLTFPREKVLNNILILQLDFFGVVFNYYFTFHTGSGGK